MSEVGEPHQRARHGSVLVVGVGSWNGLGAAIARRFAEGAYRS